MEKPYACTICGERTHSERSCPELCAPIRAGSVPEKGSGGGHSHEEDDHASLPPLITVLLPLLLQQNGPVHPQEHFRGNVHRTVPYEPPHDESSHLVVPDTSLLVV